MSDSVLELGQAPELLGESCGKEGRGEEGVTWVLEERWVLSSVLASVKRGLV